MQYALLVYLIKMSVRTSRGAISRSRVFNEKSFDSNLAYMNIKTKQEMCNVLSKGLIVFNTSGFLTESLLYFI